MKRLIISIFMLSGLSTFICADGSVGGELVFCVSREGEYAVLMEAKGECIDGEDEFSVSGSSAKSEENLLPLVASSENKDCPGGSTGTNMQVGFDKNDDGALSEDEVLTSSSSCITEPQEVTELEEPSEE